MFLAVSCRVRRLESEILCQMFNAFFWAVVTAVTSFSTGIFCTLIAGKRFPPPLFAVVCAWLLSLGWSRRVGAPATLHAGLSVPSRLPSPTPSCPPSYCSHGTFLWFFLADLFPFLLLGPSVLGLWLSFPLHTPSAFRIPESGVSMG